MAMATVTLKKGEGRTVSAGGAWVYENEIEKIDGTFENGDLVKVLASNGYPFGTGFINLNSKIRIRIMTRNKYQVIDDAFLMQRVRDCVNYRKHTVDMSSCRLIFGESDFLPGIVVDKYEDILVVQSLALGIDRYKLRILDLLKEVLKEEGMEIRGIYERSDAKVRLKEGLELVKGFIGEPFDTTVQIVENGVKYYVDVENGQKTGFFLDQKMNRAAIKPLCKGAKVLDCFTHTGSFALNAGLAGADSVLGVDASELAINEARENAKLNGLEDKVKFEVADVFDLLPELDKKGERFDVVVLDPPAFTKSRESISKAVKGYKEINLRGMKLVKDGGFLVTCSCSHFMSEELLSKTIVLAAKDAKKRLRQVEYRTQAPDHPFLWAADESFYLKFYIFQVCDEK